MRDAVRHAPMVAPLAQPGKRPTGPMHSPTHRHAQRRYDAGDAAGLDALRQAIEILGGGAAAARSLQVPGGARQTVYQWTRARVPAEYCPAIERETRRAGRPILCEQLRPDVDWGVLRGAGLAADACSGRDGGGPSCLVGADEC